MPRPDKVSQLILDLLQENHALTALEIVKKLEDKGQEFNKTSIYRAIERLQEHGQVCRYMFGGTTVVYERRDHHHDHLVCNNCGKVQTVACTIQPPQEINGFRVDHHHLTMFGVCAECAAREIDERHEQGAYSTPQSETHDQPPTDQILTGDTVSETVLVVEVSE
jgi:Fur family ferric uptake transcriptional regulator